ncbi:MAG: protein kinase [Enhygromyxa sp.]
MVELHPDLQALIGSVIHERYRVDALLGQGGMGAVFRGHHLGLTRDVAIKVLRPELGRTDAAAKRFDREAHSVSRLDHPNCVRVTDFGTTEGGIKYLVMELLEGAELEASLGQPWAPVKAIDTIVQILEGLEHAHHVGVVHRDLKPENVFVTRDFKGRELIKLVDFGIAKLIDDDTTKEQLTRAGMVFGTPRYMSPEQASGGKLDERTDLYAVGLILYEMLAGGPPFVSDEAAMLLRMHILAPPPELPPSVPPALAGIVGKLLEKSRNDRYASAREVIDALAQVRAQLEQAGAAVAGPALAIAGPGSGSRTAAAERASASVATQIEAGPDTSWNPAAPPGASMGLPLAPGPIVPPPAAPPPAHAPSPAPLPAPTPAPASTPMSPLAPIAPPLPPAFEPNAATGPRPVGDPSAAITNFAPAMATAQPARAARPWLPWAIGAGAIMLALMAFGAGQAMQQDSPDASGSKPEPRTPDPGAPEGSARGVTSEHEPQFDAEGPAKLLPGFDRQCINEDRCELSCAKDCWAHCGNADRCEISVGPESRVLCDRVGKCEVRCVGDCEVNCPRSNCEVTCTKPSSGRGKSKKPKKPKPAERCDDATYVCGDDCDD